MCHLKQKAQRGTVSGIWRINMTNYFNSEKYPDPTAYTAIKNIEKQEKLKPKSKQKQKIRSEEAK